MEAIRPVLHFIGRAEKDRTDIILLQIHHDTHHPAFEFQELSGLGIGKTIHPGHAVAYLENLAYLFEMERGIDVLQLLKEDL